ncbi:hypothetical protein DDE18_11915 [Nocardioides gansuensis]|uniref:Big-1 domain-containing protein n=1 Tax=Nocardioides gansuensis TaxID=2138300 RepID=A0A2T8F938_9ACTN|nr:post-COAP-1 domain-containing protein [Nocardioides gansuensis]PVG82203.1 hypothetical protein DDE18_11915 [Nocardioides gansuensis]
MSSADAAAGEVLVLDSTVSGGAGSTLAQKFVAAGKTPVVVDDATWASMTAAQFDAYDAIVLGDPNCGASVPAAAEANAAVWSSVVDGNVIAIGSDETFHETQGGDQLMASAAAFTVAQPGKTGAYISLSCYYHDTAPNTPVPLLSGFGTFTMTGVGCYNDAHIVATHPALTGLTDATLSNWSCSVHEAFDSFPVSFEVLAIAQGIGTSYTATDGSVGTPYILARGVTVVSDIDLAPLTAAKKVGQTHTVTATVTSDDPSPGSPVVGTTVTFTVIAGPNTGTTGTGTTNASGVASFSYPGAAVGEDTIEATFLDGLGRTQRSNRVTATWSVAANNAPNISSDSTTVQYSDALAPTMLASATDPDSDPLTMSATALPAALSGSDNGSGGFSVSGTATAVPAAYPVKYTANDGTDSSTSSDDITITKEDCTLTAPVTIQSSAAGNTTLTATLGEPDSSPGDRSGKTISFSGTDGSGPVGPFTGTTNGAGVVSVPVPLAEGVYALNASFAGDAYYYNCQTTSETIVTVSPAKFKVTGGGWISQGTGKTSFGFNAKSDVTGLHGQIAIQPSSSSKAKFHGKVVLTLSGSGNTATWTGTGKWNGVAGYKFTASVVDNGTSGKKGDTISLLVQTSGGTTVFTTGGAKPLKGGNIVVH